MYLAEDFKKRMQVLGGILIPLNEAQLTAKTGRSELGTLGYFVEEYILNITEKIIQNLDNKIKQLPNSKLIVFKNETKILNNVFNIAFENQQIKENEIKKTKFNLSVMVNMESDSKTVAILKYGALNDTFSLNSKHSISDINDFIEQITTRVINTTDIK